MNTGVHVSICWDQFGTRGAATHAAAGVSKAQNVGSTWRARLQEGRPHGMRQEPAIVLPAHGLTI